MLFTVEIYVARNGNQPFADWFNALRDIKTQARIEARLRRLGLGLFGDHCAVGGGVLELRMDFGPGFGIYFARVAQDVVLLLCGGDKSTQRSDIQRAKSCLTDYKERS